MQHGRLGVAGLGLVWRAGKRPPAGSARPRKREKRPYEGSPPKNRTRPLPLQRSHSFMLSRALLVL
eukprot:scaffold110602_cov36-Tisochrysis_lutea.AAC.2